MRNRFAGKKRLFLFGTNRVVCETDDHVMLCGRRAGLNEATDAACVLNVATFKKPDNTFNRSFRAVARPVL
jgi:hypothetical protein